MKFISPQVRHYGESVMRAGSFGCALLAGLSSTPVEAATNEAVSAVAQPHANPRLKLSYRRFAIENLDGTPIWLDGGQVDAYLLSRRWVRIGAELEGGGGHADLMGNGAHSRTVFWA